MKILADDKIPGLEKCFGKVAEIRQKPGNLINNADLNDIDILLVRTVTQVNQRLLANSHVRFVGSATSGIDHLDTHYLNRAGIQWFDAKGANARAVVNYVQACIAALQNAKKLPTHPKVGIIGAGIIGSQVAQYCRNFAAEIRLNDPPRAAKETDFISSSLTEFADLDLITIHASFSKAGDFPSYHLLNQAFLEKLNPNCILINTARGGIIDEQSLINLKQLPTLCLDVWEHEPAINLELMQQCFIATPHIAGYSQEAKLHATFMLYDRFKTLFHWPELNIHSLTEKSLSLNKVEILARYNPLQDSSQMKRALLKSSQSMIDFENLRRNYDLRKEF